MTWHLALPRFFFQPTMQPECTCKYQDKPKPYASKPGPTAPRKAPATSAISIKSQKWKNLTINDWLTIFAFIDTHPGISQTSVCNHFQSLTDGALEFNQTTLSWKLKKWEEIEAYAASFLNAVSTKCQCIVTHPEVNWALYLWLKSMEAKSEVVTGNMLCTKWRFFEQELRVPEEAQLQGEGCVKSLTALDYSAWVRLWCCEGNGSVIQWSGVQRRAQSSSWTEDERNPGIVKR